MVRSVGEDAQGRTPLAPVADPPLGVKGGRVMRELKEQIVALKLGTEKKVGPPVKLSHTLAPIGVGGVQNHSKKKRSLQRPKEKQRTSMPKKRNQSPCHRVATSRNQSQPCHRVATSRPLQPPCHRVATRRPSPVRNASPFWRNSSSGGAKRTQRSV